MKTLILIGIIALICWLTYLHIRRILKDKREIITCYTGVMGSGKSLNSVQDTLSEYPKIQRKYKKRLFLEKIKLKKKAKIKVYENKFKVSDDPPVILSNMPMIIGYDNKHKPIYCHKLKIEHILLQEAIPQYSICFIDEIGKLASQFEYKNPNIVDAFDEFIRLYRHYVDGKIICNDQSSNFIELHIRKRINTIHNLSNCFVIWRFIFYYDRQINIAEDITTIDTSQDSKKNKTDTQDNKSLKIRFMKYKNRYESRYLKMRYLKLPKSKLERYTSLYTNDILTIPKDKVYKPKTRD